MTEKPLERITAELNQWRARVDGLRVQANLGRKEATEELQKLGDRLEPAFRKAKGVLEGVVTTGANEAQAVGKSLLAGWEELRRTHRELTQEPKSESSKHH